MNNFKTFVDAYIEAALFSSNDDDERPLDENYDVLDIDFLTLVQMVVDCDKFLKANAEDVGENIDRAGADFWFTRNGHGVGFWDGDWPEDVEDRLTDAAHAFGGFDLYVAEGVIYGNKS